MLPDDQENDPVAEKNGQGEEAKRNYCFDVHREIYAACGHECVVVESWIHIVVNRSGSVCDVVNPDKCHQDPDSTI